MKYLPLIWAGLWRKRARTVLTLLCVVVAFVLFGLLHGFTAALGGIVDAMSDTRLRIMSRVNITQPLPLAHLARIETVPGVDGVSYYNFFAGYYQEPRNGVQIGRDRRRDVRRHLSRDRARPGTMSRRCSGRATARSSARTSRPSAAGRSATGFRSAPPIWTRKDGAESWDFEIVGSYRLAVGQGADERALDQLRRTSTRRAPAANGTVTLYFVKIHDASRSAEISEQIDALFANSTFETQTQSEKDWLRAQIAQIGDIGFFVNAIIAAVMFALLFVTGNTMMQSVRERIPELAVLEDLRIQQYGRRRASCSPSRCCSAASRRRSVSASRPRSRRRSIASSAPAALNLPWSVVAVGLGLAAAFAIVSAALPALRAQRLSIVDALAGR